MARNKSNQIAYVVLTEDNTEHFFCTTKEIAEFLNDTKWVVLMTLKGNSTRLVKRGVAIFTIEEYNDLKPVREHRISTEAWVTRKRRVHKLDRYTNEILETYESLIDAAVELGGYSSVIGKACRGKIKTAYGYKWEYAGFEETN